MFLLHISGKTLGHLEVLLAEVSPSGVKTVETLVWNLRGHQADIWKKANVSASMTFKRR